MPKTILILDDDVHLAKALELEFEDHGYAPVRATSISQIPKQAFAYALVDIRLVGEFGLNAIEKLKQFSPHCKIVVLSGYASVATTVEAIKRGAINCLVKPASFSQIEAAFHDAPPTLNEKTKLRPPSLTQIQNEYIDYVLIQNEGNISKTAKDLGIHRQSLQRKLKKHS